MKWFKNKFISESKKSAEDIEKENELLEDLVKVVEERNKVTEDIEEQRIKFVFYCVSNMQFCYILKFLSTS